MPSGIPITIQDKGKFLKKLLSTHGNVARACRAIKISRNAAYDHRKIDPDFGAAWDEILETVADEMEQELVRRSTKGYLEPVFYQGQEIAQIRKFSDKLLEVGLKAKRPEKYRERLDLNANHSGALDHNIQIVIDQVYGNDDTNAADDGPADSSQESGPDAESPANNF
jgi:hypothetical protein